MRIIKNFCSKFLQTYPYEIRGQNVIRKLSSNKSEVSLSTSNETQIDLKKIDEFVDKETHTGQKFEENDYRLSRFLGGKLKKVNTRFAIDLINEIPPKAVKGRKVSCDGGGGPLGHPKVYINLDEPGNHTCGYCGLRFYQDHTSHHH
ncbi:putative NADH dehydrogenase [ubiquinone] iron-sulfur protein 6 [Sarcoptes scabiei]|nr:putative NADH dehydrogenase [ubiquinone] iron-sulfur protein 6 [Sarcoptes scabiei]UXI18829.1 hypothetical protein NH340_JMT04772 [Sarcoptes scabiei]